MLKYTAVIHRIILVRILEWVATSYFRVASPAPGIDLQDLLAIKWINPHCAAILVFFATSQVQNLLGPQEGLLQLLRGKRICLRCDT